MTGTYHIEAYIADNNGILNYLGGLNQEIKTTATPSVTATGNSAQTTYTLAVSNATYPGMKEVRYAVWSKDGGQDDLSWCSASKGSDGKWKVNVSIKEHGTAGIYYVDAYAILPNGNTYIGGTTFNVTGPTMNKDPEVSNINVTAGTFDVTIPVTSTSGISRVSVPVWTTKNHSDLAWYTPTKQSDGTYKVHVDMENHNYNYGTYYIDVYAIDNNGINKYVGGTHTELTMPEVQIDATGNSAETVYTLTAKNLPYRDQLSELQFAVWSKNGGQDDLEWYHATGKSGVWSTNVNINAHGTAGTYLADAYLKLKNGGAVYVGTTTFEVSAAKAGTLEIRNADASAGTFDIVLLGISSKCGISKLSVPVWTQQDHSDIAWYTAAKQKDGSFVVHVDMTNHKYHYGNYKIDVYVTDNNRIYSYLQSGTYDLNKPETKVEATANSTETSFQLKASGITYGNNVQKVQFAVWTQQNGQDDIQWNVAQKQGSNWIYNVPIDEYRRAGTYEAHAYALMKDGSFVYQAMTTFTVAGPKADAPEADLINTEDGTFVITLSNVKSASGIAKVQIPVWCANDRSDLVWYTATKSAGGTYKVYVDCKNHDGNLGTYIADAYITDNNGITIFAGEAKAVLNNCTNKKYNIMGSTSITASQLVAYYNANEHYPSFYSDSDAPNLQTFCQMYIDECNAEGVKAEVAFCQAMKETGFLRFKNCDVKISQYNFAGLGATGGVPGNSFSTVREGIRAQIQHLKAYASTEPLNNTCVDERFKYVSPRGGAPYVEWIGKQENPIPGYGWATDKGYGYSIKNDYIAKLLTY